MDNIYAFKNRQSIHNQAGRWLLRLDGDTPPSTAELDELRQWLAQSKEHRAAFNELRQSWDGANVLTELAIPLQPARPKLWARLSMPQTLAAAATVLLALGLALGHWLEPYNQARHNGIYQTRLGEQQTTRLADGSEMLLNTQSKVSVSYSDNQRRITLLEGEAYFVVKKDRDRPFDVFVGQGQVRAVGTAFSVRLKDPSDNSPALSVTVSEGEVQLRKLNQELTPAVNEANPSSQLIGALEAGQRIAFDPSQGQAISAQIENLQTEDLDRQTAWQRGLLMFDGDPLHNVLEEINRYTDIEIVVTDPALYNIRIGGQFRIGETQGMLDALESNLNLVVTPVNDKLVRLSPAPQ